MTKFLSQVKAFFSGGFTKVYDAFEATFITVVDEDAFTPVRNPQAILPEANSWLAQHPIFIILFFGIAFVAGLLRVFQRIKYDTQPYYKNMMDFFADVANHVEGIQDAKIPLPTSEDEYYRKANELSKKLKLGYKFIAKDGKIQLYKKINPDITPKANKFEKFIGNIFESKIVKFVLTPPWLALDKASYLNWITWFSAVLITALSTGALASLTLAVTGTVVLTWPAIACVIGIPLAIFALYYAFNMKNLKNQINAEEIADESGEKYQLVTDKAQKNNIISYLGQAYAIELHTQVNAASLLKGRDPTEINRIKNQAKPAHNPANVQTPAKSHKRQILWKAFDSARIGLTKGAFTVGLTTTVITAVAIKFGITALIVGLSMSVVGIPLSVLISLTVGIFFAAGYSASRSVAASLKYKTEDEFCHQNPEFSSEQLALEEANRKAFLAEYKTNIKYNNILEHLTPNAFKFNYQSMKDKNPAFIGSNQSSPRKVFEYLIAAVSKGGNLAYITRFFLLGGIVSTGLLLVAGIVINPLTLGLIAAGAALTFAVVAVVEKYYKEKELSISDLCMQRFELDQKQELTDCLEFSLTTTKEKLADDNAQLKEQILEKNPHAFEKSSTWQSVLSFFNGGQKSNTEETQPLILSSPTRGRGWSKTG